MISATTVGCPQLRNMLCIFFLHKSFPGILPVIFPTAWYQQIITLTHSVTVFLGGGGGVDFQGVMRLCASAPPPLLSVCVCVCVCVCALATSPTQPMQCTYTSYPFLWCANPKLPPIDSPGLEGMPLPDRAEKLLILRF